MNGPVEQRSVLEQYTGRSVVETKISMSYPLIQERQATLEKKIRPSLTMLSEICFLFLQLIFNNFTSL